MAGSELEVVWRPVASPMERPYGSIGIAMSIYSSFLLRCWLQRGDAPDTYALEHVQSGEQFRAATPAELLHWIDANIERLAAGQATAALEPEGDESNISEKN